MRQFDYGITFLWFADEEASEAFRKQQKCAFLSLENIFAFQGLKISLELCCHYPTCQVITFKVNNLILP